VVKWVADCAGSPGRSDGVGGYLRLAGVRRDNQQSSRSAQGCAEDAGLRDVQRDIRKPSGRYITKQGRNGRGAGGTVGGAPLLHLYSRHTAKHLVNTDQPRATRSGRSRCFLSRRGVVSAFSGEPSTQDDRHDRAVTRDSVPRPMSDRRHTRYHLGHKVPPIP
jgi:hypothetical protein